MSLPATSDSAKAEFGRRVTNFEELVENLAAGPDWAKNAFGRATNSMPMVTALLQLDEKAKSYFQGFMAGMLADDFLQVMSEVEMFTKGRADKEPTHQKLREHHEVVAKYNKKWSELLERKTGEALVSGGATSGEFLEGLNKWKKVKPPQPLLKSRDGEVGNLATTPYLYMAVFWRGFAELSSLKKAYFALFCMFDKNEALAGSYEAFRKRARAIGLTYSKEA